MSSVEMIILGIYTLIVVPAVLAPLVWAAVLDGRYHVEQQPPTPMVRDRARPSPTPTDSFLLEASERRRHKVPMRA
jgi:hypothetical protein